MADDYDRREDLGWFRDELRQRDRLVAELRSEQDELNDLVRRLREHAEDYVASIESWCETFKMELNDKGEWIWQRFWNEYADLVENYQALVKRWNRAVPIINAGVQDVGRPLAASEAQVDEVLSLHHYGNSLREIVDATSLGMRTVRTIIDREHARDRTTKARREKIEISKFQRAEWKRQKRTGDALPKRVQVLIKSGNALVTEAKGLGRGR